MAPRGGASYTAAAGGVQAQGPRGQGGQVAQPDSPGLPQPGAPGLVAVHRLESGQAHGQDEGPSGLPHQGPPPLKVQASDLRAVSVEHVNSLLILQLATRESFQAAQ